MKIALAGNQWVSKYLLDYLLEQGHKVELIINISPRLKNSISGYFSFADYCREHQTDLYEPTTYSLSSEQDKLHLKSYEIDVLLVFGWQRLIPEWLIKHTKIAVLGVHGGPEKPPRCRGRAVFNWALIMGFKKFYMYCFQITPEVDSGDILELKAFNISEHDDIKTIYNKNCAVSSRMFSNVLNKISAGTLQPVPQSQEGATYLPGRRPENGGIDWSWSAERIYNFVRAQSKPYPMAFTSLHCGAVVRINRCYPFDECIPYRGTPGEIVDCFEDGDFVVTCGDGESVYVCDYEIVSLHPNKISKGDCFDQISGTGLAWPDI